MPSPNVAARATVVLACLLMLAGVVGCGSDGDETASDPSPTPASSPTETTTSPAPTTPSDPGPPACEDVWVDGKKLPFRYRGCLEGSREVKADKQPCSFGYPIVTYDNRFYAVTGSRINQVASLKADDGYQQALSVCTG